MVSDNTIVLSMVHDIYLCNRHEVPDSTPRTSSETERIGHAAAVVVNDLKDLRVPTVNAGEAMGVHAAYLCL